MLKEYIIRLCQTSEMPRAISEPCIYNGLWMQIRYVCTSRLLLYELCLQSVKGFGDNRTDRSDILMHA